LSNKKAEILSTKILKNYDYATKLDEDDIKSLIAKIRYMLKKQPLCKRIQTGSVLAVGDIHGDFNMLKKVISIFQKDKQIDHLIFLGDVVDRGSQSIACVNLIFALIIAQPDKVHFIRGNHEAITVNSRYGFADDIQAFGADEDLFLLFNYAFSELPITLVHEKQKIFYVHGGIPIKSCLLEDIDKLPKGDMQLNNEIIKQLLWNDPKNEILQHGYSMRGEGIFNYGLELVEEFLKKNNLEMIVRAHEAFSDGYKYFFDKKVLSIFTSEEYYEYIHAKIALIDEKRVIQIFHPNDYEYALTR